MKMMGLDDGLEWVLASPNQNVLDARQLVEWRVAEWTVPSPQSVSR